MALIRAARVMLVLAALATLAGAAGCQLKDDSAAQGIPPPPDVAAPPADAITTPSGLAYKVVRVGLGSIHPSLRNTVTVHYTGWTTDGKMFESSYQSGKAATFGVDGVIPGWTELLQLMVVKEKCRVWIPARLAYGDHPSGGNPGGMLVFEIELLDIR
jgi:FKBP-type peptidyl-prolyl cis-trans isomerase